ncbi:sortase domain-bontaining protein [Aeromicrobium sp. Leaf350]|uniref:sortase domain-containing protein n=1 Tax=Aeromicrobium sp. Leaf350 TaxID=2876565 RepID=UPI001E470E5E|nr:sortase [Aeromicrobium sp. Leaf350]
MTLIDDPRSDAPTQAVPPAAPGTVPPVMPPIPPRLRGRRPGRPPVTRAPRAGRWWGGAALLSLSLLLLGFITHVTVFSSIQHDRAQSLQYQELRSSLAKAETPVGQLDLDKKLVGAGTPVALLQIPRLGIEEVVGEGTTSDLLRSGPGHQRSSVMPGQNGTAVILGRQTTYGAPFADLERLVPGDTITVVTGQGTHTFTVSGLRRDGDDKLPIPGDGEGRLELVTADGLPLFPSGALHVDAELTSPTVDTPTRVMSVEALPPEERAMGHDGSAWFTAFFAGTFLLAAIAGMAALWLRWRRGPAWIIGVPVVVALAAVTADSVMNALPNLL